MILSQLKAENYKVFGRQSPENKTGNISSVQYIEDLAGRTGVSISHWDIGELFKDPDARSFHLIRDKNKINKIFFETQESMKGSKDDQYAAIEKALKDTLDKISGARIKRQLERLKQERDRYITSAASKQKEASDAVANAFKISTDLARLSNGELGISSQITEILKAGFWDFLEFNGNQIIFTNTQDIINTEVNPSAGLDLRVNLGKFKVMVNAETLQAHVWPHSGNVRPRSSPDYYHPHVSNGEICWGNASAKAAEYQGNGDIKNLMELLAVLLSTYSSQNPYQALTEFASSAPADARVKPTEITEAVKTVAEELHRTP